MKISCNYLILCEKILKTSNGLLSFINIFEVINIKKLPSAQREFSIAFELSLSDVKKLDEYLELQLNIVNPKGKIIITKNVKMPVLRKKIAFKKLRGILSFNMLPIKTIGVYKVILNKKTKKIASLSFEVKELK